MEGQGLNHWTVREVPKQFLSINENAKSELSMGALSFSTSPVLFQPFSFYFTNFRNSFMFSEFILKFHLEPQSAKAHVDDEIALY